MLVVTTPALQVAVGAVRFLFLRLFLLPTTVLSVAVAAVAAALKLAPFMVKNILPVASARAAAVAVRQVVQIALAVQAGSVALRISSETAIRETPVQLVVAELADKLVMARLGVSRAVMAADLAVPVPLVGHLLLATRTRVRDLMLAVLGVSLFRVTQILLGLQQVLDLGQLVKVKNELYIHN
jgi:hypothetical protein